jgi:hypothetical protein
MKRMLVLSLMLLVALGCSKREKQGVKNDNGKGAVLKYIAAIKIKDAYSAVVATNKVEEITKNCSSRHKNENQELKETKIKECQKLLTKGVIDNVQNDIALNLLPGSSKFEYIEGKAAPNKPDTFTHVIKVEYTDSNDTPRLAGNIWDKTAATSVSKIKSCLLKIQFNKTSSTFESIDLNSFEKLSSF